MKPSIENGMLQEIWKVKDTLAAKYGNNVDTMFRSMRKREKRSGHKLVSFNKTRRKPTRSAAK